MSRITALSMLTEAEGKAYLAERYGAVIEGLQKSLVSASMKNKELSGDPDAGSLEAKRFVNASAKAYGTARTAGKGDKVKAQAVTVPLDQDKEIIEELAEKDVRLLGIEGVIDRRTNNHVLVMNSELDKKFFACAADNATSVNLTGYDKIEDKLEAFIQELETTQNDFVDGIPREIMRLVLSPKYYGLIRNQLDKQERANVDTGTESFNVWHGVETQSCVHLPTGVDAIIMADGAVAQPVYSNGYKAEKIPLSDDYAVELFFYYGTKAVTPDLIFKPATFTKVNTASETYDSSKTYYTESNGVYTVAEITSFASGTTYYTMN